MILNIACIIVSFVFGILLCNLILEDVRAEDSLSRTRICFYYTVSAMFMGCAFLCASLHFQAESCMEGMAVLSGLIFLAVFAIQDMLQKAVYAFLLNVGTVGIVMLRCMIYVLDGEFTNVFSFLILSGIVYAGLKGIAKVFPKFMGCGDYDILFVMFVLCGANGVVQALFASSVAGLVICVPQLLAKRINKNEKVPLAPFLYLGTLAYFVL